MTLTKTGLERGKEGELGHAIIALLHSSQPQLQHPPLALPLPPHRPPRESRPFVSHCETKGATFAPEKGASNPSVAHHPTRNTPAGLQQNHSSSARTPPETIKRALLERRLEIFHLI